MSNTYIGKNDMLVVDESNLSMSNSKLVKNLLNGVTDCISLITAIEEYNDDNKLGIGKRINYAISTGINYISVLKAYPADGSHTLVIGWDSNGKSFTMRDDNASKGAIMSGLSTHLIPNDKICDVVIGSYDEDQLNDILNTFKTNDNIPENTLFAIINTLYNDMLNYISAGNYRGAIELFNYTFKHNKLNEYDYHHKLKAYNKYVEVFVRYILALKDIVVEYNEYVNTKDGDTPTLKKKHLFTFVETEDEIDNIIAEKNKDILNTPIYNDQLPFWRTDMLQNTFYVSEVEEFKQLIDFDHMKFDQNGLPYWTN